MNPTFDVAIVGAGPAGSSAAITAARGGAKVLLLDRDQFPRTKVCGEFVSAESLSLLTDLIGPDHSLLNESISISDGRLFFGGGVTDTHISPPARSIPRFDLDHALWLAAGEAGVTTHSTTSVDKLTGNGPFLLHRRDHPYEARALINASGRWSGLTQALEPPRGPKWLGLKAHYSSASADASVDLYFFRHGYCGIQPVRSGVINVCAMVRADVATSLSEVFGRHAVLESRMRGAEALTETVVTAPLLFGPPAPCAGEVLQVGDAAGFIDPFLGDGISLALQTGSCAARELLPFLSGARTLEQAAHSYAESYRRDILPAFHHAARLRRILSISEPFQPAVRGLLKVPHITEWFLKKTRPKAMGSG